MGPSNGYQLVFGGGIQHHARHRQSQTIKLKIWSAQKQTIRRLQEVFRSWQSRCGMVCGGGDIRVSAVLVAPTISASVYASRPSHKSIHPEHRSRRSPLLCLTTFCYRHCAFQCLSCQGISLLYSALVILLLGRHHHAIHHGQGSTGCRPSTQQVLVCSQVDYCTQEPQSYTFQWPTFGQQGVCSSIVHVINTAFTTRPPR